jgi:hypothetical protein
VHDLRRAENFANWAALVAARPDWRVGLDLPLIIAEDVGLWTFSTAKVSKAGK